MQTKRGEIASGSQALRINRLWLLGTSVSQPPRDAFSGDATAGGAARHPVAPSSRGSGRNKADIASQMMRKQLSFADSISLFDPGSKVSGSASGSTVQTRFPPALILELKRSIHGVEGLDFILAGLQNC